MSYSWYIKRNFLQSEQYPKNVKMHEGIKIGFPPHLLSFLRSFHSLFKLPKKYISKLDIYSFNVCDFKKIIVTIFTTEYIHSNLSFLRSFHSLFKLPKKYISKLDIYSFNVCDFKKIIVTIFTTEYIHSNITYLFRGLIRWKLGIKKSWTLLIHLDYVGENILKSYILKMYIRISV